MLHGVRHDLIQLLDQLIRLELCRFVFWRHGIESLKEVFLQLLMRVT
jgi:hypothetical protein